MADTTNGDAIDFTGTRSDGADAGTVALRPELAEVVEAELVDDEPAGGRPYSVVQVVIVRPIEAAVSRLHELYGEVGRREARLADLGAKRVTRSLAKAHRDMRPIVALFSECHELFGHDEVGAAAAWRHHATPDPTPTDHHEYGTQVREYQTGGHHPGAHPMPTPPRSGTPTPPRTPTPSPSATVTPTPTRTWTPTPTCTAADNEWT